MTTVRWIAALAASGLAGFAASELRPRSGAPGADLRRVEDRLEALAGAVEALHREQGTFAPARAACPALPAQAAAASATVPTPQHPISTDPAPPAGASPYDPAAEDALQRGRDLLADARSRGSWTDDDTAGFRDALAAAGEDGREELTRALVLAINEGRVRLEVQGAPF